MCMCMCVCYKKLYNKSKVLKLPQNIFSYEKFSCCYCTEFIYNMYSINTQTNNKTKKHFSNMVWFTMQEIV